MPYSLAIRARDLVNGNAPKISVEASITRQIRLLLFSKQGECRYDTAYGSGLWENDFDLDATTTEWRDKIKRTIENVLKQYEPRLHITDFVVDIREGLNSDQFLWSPKVMLHSNTGLGTATSENAWNAEFEFRGPPSQLLNRWGQLAQVLMLANEFMFVD